MRELQATFSDKHLARALYAIAGERCSTDLTDGFCGPGNLHPEHRLVDPAAIRCHRGEQYRSCVQQARGALSALASHGMMVVWVYDKELPEEVRAPLQRAFEERHRG